MFYFYMLLFIYTIIILCIHTKMFLYFIQKYFYVLALLNIYIFA